MLRCSCVGSPAPAADRRSVIDRRTCIGRLGVGILAIPFAAEAHQTGKKRPVVALVTPSAFPRALTPELVRLGYVPGQHITIEYRQTTQAERLGPLMADLATRADIIVAVGSPAVIAASQRLTRSRS